MGMLIQRHRQRSEGQSAPAPRRRRKPSKRTAKPAPAGVEGSDYTSLSDEQVAEAYAVTFPEGEAAERDAQVTELRALNVNRDGFDSDPE